MSQSQSSLTLQQLRPHLRRYTGTIIFTVIFLLAGRLVSALDPIWLKKIIDGASNHHPWNAIRAAVAAYFILRAVSALFDYLRDLVFAKAEMGISRDLARSLMQQLLDLPMQYHVEQKIGAVSRKITRDSRAVTFILDFLVINILPTVVELVIVTALLWSLYGAAFALLTLGTVVAYTWFTLWSTELRQKYRIAANEADDEVATLEVEALSHIETVKYFQSEDYLLERYKPATELRYEMGKKSNQLFALISAGQAAILLVGLGLILYLAIIRTVNGTLTVGDLVLLTTYVSRLSAPISVLGFIYRQIKDGLADIAGMSQILAEKVAFSRSGHQEVQHPKGNVHFQDVTFGYSPERTIMHNFSLDVPAGAYVAFVGSSGAGKSTLAKMLFRLYEPQSGSIHIDGADIATLSTKARQSLLGIVSQEPALFNSSIKENVRFGKPHATDDEVLHALHLANLDSLIAKLPEGIDTMVGERGVKLSGGEKQRIAIARAVIRDPKVLVLDEATSSLDSESEHEIQSALKAASAGRTTLAIAHRLSTIADADVIYVLGKGGILEQGTHTELLKLDGAYARLWKLQAKA